MEKYCTNKLGGYDEIPNFIPKKPEAVYRRSGWINYKNWLGQRPMNFEEARDFVHSLKLINYEEWNLYCKGELKQKCPKPQNIPRDPNLRYRDKWHSWGDWFGLENPKQVGEWRDFQEAREFIRSLSLSGTLDWKKYCKGELEGYDDKPYDIPSTPDIVYKDDWINYSDWLDTTHLRKKQTELMWRSFEEARDYVRSLNLETYDNWKMYINDEMVHLEPKPVDIPNSPYFVYKDLGWKCWNDFLN